MARIAEQEIERLKQDISLERLLESQGIKLKRTGKDLVGTCPFHHDKTPSLVVTPSKNLWHCLGACQTGGSVIDWVMKKEGISFKHAVELLKDGVIPDAVVNTQPVKRSSTTKLPVTLEPNTEDQALLNRVVDFYHNTLKQTPEALSYLENRGINNEAIDHFKLGFANRTLGYRLPEKNRKAGAEIRSQLQKTGILRESGHEHFNGSVVIPMVNQGQVLEIYGRKVGDRLRKGTPKHLYLPGPHQGVFNLEALADSKEIILCESLIDALTFWCAGFQNVTCSYGIEGFTDELFNALKQHQVERVLIAYDRDEAGEKASFLLAARLLESGIDAYRIHFPKGMDANEYALQVTPANKSLGTAIRGSVWLGSGKPPETKIDIPVPDEKPAAGVAPQPKEKSVQQKGRAEPLPASVMPEAPSPEIAAEIKSEEIIINLGQRRYRIRGLKHNTSPNQLKVNILANQGDLIHVDTFDLYSAKARYSFIKQTSIELSVAEEVIKKDLGKVLLKCEALQEESIEKTLETKDKIKALGDSEREAALELLKDKNLLGRILDDFHTAGVVGEETNKLVGYLAAVSRKLDKPLAIIVQSTSAAGKSSLMDAVLNMMPEEERVQYSAMTGQSLFYMGETNLKNKILAIAEEEGAANASYALKLLQSEGELTIASTGKDDNTGTLVTKEYHVEGPVMLFLTTTAIDIDEELMNRCVVLTVNESREQTQAIHVMQRKQQTLEGLLQSEDKKQIIQLHRNAQRMLRPLLVANPFAEQLTFIDDKTRTRRDHMKYLTLIKTVTLLHQYQREVKTVEHNGQQLEYIEVALSDIEVANQLAHDVLGRTLDELPPQTHTLLKHIKQMVTEACKAQGVDQSDYRFSRRDIREYSQWGNTQIRVHLDRLMEMEYLLAYRGRQGQSFVYELLYDGDLANRKHLMGLIDVDCLEKNEGMTETSRGRNANLAGCSRPINGHKTGGCRGEKSSPQPSLDKALNGTKPENTPERYIEVNSPASCRTSSLAAQGG